MKCNHVVFLFAALISSVIGCSNGIESKRISSSGINQTAGYSQQMVIRAADGVTCPLLASEVRSGENGFIFVPRRSRLTFVQATRTNAWTTDPMRNFERQLKSQDGADVDYTEALRALARHSNDVVSAAMDVFGRMVGLGITSSGCDGGKNDPMYLFTMAGAMSYVKNEIAPLATQWDGVSKLERRVRCQNNQGCIVVCKRLMALSRYLVHDLSDFGPYIGLEGDNTSDFRLPGDAAEGALIARRYELNGKTLEPNGRGSPFFSKDHSFDNSENCPVWVRIGINDSLPEDNGVAGGYATILVNVKPL